jgi:DNA gyrase/topoisomerase IV subunit A
MENLFEDQDIIDINIEDSVKASYLDYSMSVIIGRALPPEFIIGHPDFYVFCFE